MQCPIHRRSLMAGLLGALTTPAAQTQTLGPPPFALKVAMGAELRAEKPEIYDPAYVRLSYPMGDVPDDRGVCTDTVIRAFRHAGVDLQAEVHEDMRANFAAYPKLWGLTRPDRNIDHRRVPNLETLFRRKGAALALSEDPEDFQPGDVVSWRLASGLPHIGVVTRKSSGQQPLVAHNIGMGTQLEACLFDWTMKGWFRFVAWS
jgi:uncharacterized protein